LVFITMVSFSRISRCNSIMLLISLSVISLFCSTVVSNPVPKSPPPLPKTSCKNPIIRKEWRNLSSRDQQKYLSAVQCFLTKPGITPPELAPGVVSRYDDLIATHSNQTLGIHYVGHFLPWHRLYTAYYESALRKECGYDGAQPYWDWNLDVGSEHGFKVSPIFDAVNGFGGNGPYIPITDPALAGFAVPGRTGGGCVPDGPFHNMTVRIGPGKDLSGNPRCLSRDWSPYFARRYLQRNQTRVSMDQPDFYSFDKSVEGGPSFEASGIHGGGHYGIGGTLGIMGDLYVSPGDPIFFLHHANLDRVWWSWQMKNQPARLTDFGGPSCILDYYTPAHPQACPNETLSQTMDLGVNFGTVTVADTMNIQGDTLCYDYDELYNL